MKLRTTSPSVGARALLPHLKIHAAAGAHPAGQWTRCGLVVPGARATTNMRRVTCAFCRKRVLRAAAKARRQARAAAVSHYTHCAI